jgi:holo-[acyl-carrier protein] synthase
VIYGIGTDIVATARIADILARYGDAFARRILAADEWPAYKSSNSPARFLAKRFAAKEAFAKAAGTGLRHPVSLGNISIGHDALGRPELRFQPALSAWLAGQGITGQHLSVSDERELAAAFVVLERQEA